MIWNWDRRCAGLRLGRCSLGGSGWCGRLGAAGGSSGSPVFNPKGEVIGILSAGNFVGQVNLETGEKTRAPSAVMINFAQRIDILREILPADIPN